MIIIFFLVQFPSATSYSTALPSLSSTIERLSVTCRSQKQPAISPSNSIKPPHSPSRQYVILFHHPLAHRHTHIQHSLWHIQKWRRWNCTLPLPGHSPVHEPIYHPFKSGHPGGSTMGQWGHVSDLTLSPYLYLPYHYGIPDSKLTSDLGTSNTSTPTHPPPHTSPHS